MPEYTETAIEWIKKRVEYYENNDRMAISLTESTTKGIIVEIRHWPAQCCYSFYGHGHNARTAAVAGNGVLWEAIIQKTGCYY